MRRHRGRLAALAAVMALGLLPGIAPAHADDPPAADAPADGPVPAGPDAVVAPAAQGPDIVLERGATVTASLAQSVPYVGAPSLHSAGVTGEGTVIVVIDTGVASGFGGTLVGSACFAAEQTSTELDGDCGPTTTDTQAFSQTCFDLGVCDDGNAYYVFDASAGRPCPNGKANACMHGSAVAATAARHTAPVGVAPDAGVYSIRVFNDRGTSADLVDLYLALDHARQLAEAHLPIAAINMSVATASVFAGACDSSYVNGINAKPFRDLVLALQQMGIPTTVASGNAGVTGKIAFPSCLSRAVAVGATDLDDDVAFYSNTGPGIDLLAPGSREASSSGVIQNLVIPSGTLYDKWSGTSFSAPHVAGAFALLQEVYPQASPAQLESLLERRGVPVAFDGRTFKRLRIEPAVVALPGNGLLFPATTSIAASSRVGVGDFDGDGHADVLAHVPGGGADRVAYGRTGYRLTVTSRAVQGTYVPVIGNFRGASTSPDDILWYAPGTPADSLWVGNANRTFSVASASVAGTFQPLVGDYDGDGWDDVLWFAPGPAVDKVWYGGATGFTAHTVSIDGPTRAAVGDFDGDSKDDVVLHGPGTAPDALWRGTATRGTFAVRSFALGCDCRLLAGNFDGDADDDVLLYQPGSAGDWRWSGGPGVGSTSVDAGFSSTSMSVSGTFTPVAGDLDGDGLDDVIWYAPGSGADLIWLGRPSGFSPRPLSVTGTYRMLTGDLDAAVGDDLVMVSATSSATPVWWGYSPPAP